MLATASEAFFDDPGIPRLKSWEDVKYFDVDLPLIEGSEAAMVRYSADNSWLDDDALSKISDAVNSRGRLFKITASVDEAAEAKRQLELEGKHVTIETMNGLFKVMITQPKRIKATKSVMTGMRQVGDGLYKQVMNREAGVYDYEFDDGAIWRLETMEDGDYLIKEVSDQNEDVVIRQASAKREMMVNGDNYRQAMTLVYGGADDRFVHDVERCQPLKRELIAMLNGKVEGIVETIIRQHRLANKLKVDDVLRRTVASCGATTVDDLTRTIVNMIGRR